MSPLTATQTRARAESQAIRTAAIGSRLCDTPWQREPFTLTGEQALDLLAMRPGARRNALRVLVRAHEWHQNDRRLRTCFGTVLWTTEMEREFHDRMERDLDRLTDKALAVLEGEHCAEPRAAETHMLGAVA